LIISSNTEMRTSMAFVSIVCLSVMGLALYGLIAAAEVLFMPWERRSNSAVPVIAATN
jgi:ABC-type nitrate/sulfonate/bicarbonate transport system permease component